MTTPNGEAPQVDLTTENATGVITLHRPGKMNALTKRLNAELLAALEECERRDDIRAIVIRGRGDHFCAGADIDEMGAEGTAIARYMQDVFAFFTRIEDCRKPTLASVDGYCLGGGLELALACDVIIASDRARFGLPETGIGLVPGFAIQRLSAALGGSAAANVLFSDRFVTAPRAYDLGLLHRVVPAQALEEETRAVTGHLATLAPLAVEVAKEALRSHRRSTADLDHSVWANTALYASDRAQAGLSAFRNGNGGRRSTRLNSS
jgi:enoyl-CoA hydratase/carnithine racemase